MGLFDSVFGSFGETKPLSPAESFAGILLGASACDGHIADEEIQSLFTILTRMKTFENWTGPKYNTMMDRLLGVLKRQGVEELVKQCAATVEPELRETVFAGAADLVLADGIVEPAEKEFLNMLVRELNIAGDKALTIVEVMIIKNKG